MHKAYIIKQKHCETFLALPMTMVCTASSAYDLGKMRQTRASHFYQKDGSGLRTRPTRKAESQQTKTTTIMVMIPTMMTKECELRSRRRHISLMAIAAGASRRQVE
jgi:hypothetical protein